MDRLASIGYSPPMSSQALARLFREWAALLAVLAMALGPLGSAVGRSLAAQDHVAVAAGLVAPLLCEPGGLPAKPPSPCDHCTLGVGFTPPCPTAAAAPLVFAERLDPADTGPSALPARLRLPPATGPPAA